MRLKAMQMGMSPTSCSHKAGFTLIEVLIALAIVAIAMTAVIKAASQNIRATQYLQNKTMAMWVGELVLNEARVGVLALPDKEVKETRELLNRTWFITIEKNATSNNRIEKIQVKVYQQEEHEEVSPLVDLESYIYHDQAT